MGLPEVPTLAEAGVPGYEFAGWYGLFGPAALPVETAARMHAAIEAALAEPALRARLRDLGADLNLLGPAAFAAFLREDDARWARAAQEGLVTRAVREEGAMRRRCLLAVAAATAAPSARAETGGGWPQRTITLVVPSAPGGTLDALARLFAQAMTSNLGRTVVVENASGAGGLIGMQRAARAEPDGHTLVFGNMGVMAASVAVNPDPGYDPRRDLAPVGLAADVPMVLAASPQSGVRTLQALLARIRERGDAATFGTAGLGTTSHLAPALLLHLTKLKATLVSYRGAGPAMSDLAAGVVDAVIDQTVTMIPTHRGRTAVALAVTGAERVPQLPEVPTFAEAGVPAFDLVVWNAIAAPRGTPPAIVERLAKSLEAALADEELRRRLAELAAVPPAREERGPEALRRRIASDIERWTGIVQASSGMARQ